MSYKTFLFLCRLVLPILVQFVAVVFGIKAVRAIKEEQWKI